MNKRLKSSSSKKSPIPRGKSHRKTQAKTTVGLYLSKNLVERARKHKLNISRITEQALSSVLDYLETQNRETSHPEGISTAVRLSHQ